MTLTWNVVTKNLEPTGFLLVKLRQKIAKLEKHLLHFPPDAVHLQIHLEKHPRKTLFITALTLRVPSNILRAEKREPEPVAAFDRAVGALIRELGSFKSELRREQQWRRRGRNDRQSEIRARRFAEQPLPAGEGPQTTADAVREMLTPEQARLVDYLRRRIPYAEAEDSTYSALDAQTIASEAINQALASLDQKPRRQSYRVWLYSVARKEMQKWLRRREARQREIVPLDALADSPSISIIPEDDQIRVTGVEEESFTAETLSDAGAERPDIAASRHDLVEYLSGAARNWPPQERSVFELHFLQGFDPGEVASLEGLTPARTAELIDKVQQRLRELVRDAAEIAVRRHTPPYGEQTALAQDVKLRKL